MIAGIGVDILTIDRIAAVLERYPERFSARILSSEELIIFNTLSPTRKIHYLAKHFAAKEAFVKALGTGFRQGIDWRDLHIARNAEGKPYFIVSEKVQKKLTARTISNIHLSLSDEQVHVVAFVILET